MWTGSGTASAGGDDAVAEVVADPGHEGATVRVLETLSVQVRLHVHIRG
jgi:hypothetical protein